MSEFGYLGRIPGPVSFTASVCEYAPSDEEVPAFIVCKMSHADFTRDVALNYVKRGYHLLCRHAITLFLLPVAGTILVSTSGMSTYMPLDVHYT